MAFALGTAIQVGFYEFKAGTKVVDNNAKYETIFQKAKYTTIEGKIIEPSKLKAPVVIVNFWAYWCNPCLEEMPSMAQLKKKFNNDEVQIIAFNTDDHDQLKSIQKSLKKLNITNEFNVIADKNTQVADEYGFSAIPVTVIYVKGKVEVVSNGPMDFSSEEFNEKVRGWIKK